MYLNMKSVHLCVSLEVLGLGSSLPLLVRTEVLVEILGRGSSSSSSLLVLLPRKNSSLDDAVTTAKSGVQINDLKIFTILVLI